MKRLNFVYDKICSLDNLRLADANARKGKSFQYGVIIHDKNCEENILKLHEMLKNKTYVTSPYTTFKIYEPKERVVYRLPYYPDRITHHAVMNVMEDYFVSLFTADTYSCIKGKGIYGALKAVQAALRDVPNTQYCLKMDVKKFYPNVDHDILKALLKHKIRDRDLLWLLGEIIDSADGLPIGNYLSQYFANYYLSFFDRWIKEEKCVRNYFRYADDLVILNASKEHLHKLLNDIRIYFEKELKLTIKHNYQIFPVDKRGIDFVGYVFFHGYILLRPRIKKRFARMLARNSNPASIASYKGWLKHCNGKHLLKKLLHENV